MPAGFDIELLDQPRCDTGQQVGKADPGGVGAFVEFGQEVIHRDGGCEVGEDIEHRCPALRVGRALGEIDADRGRLLHRQFTQPVWFESGVEPHDPVAATKPGWDTRPCGQGKLRCVRCTIGEVEKPQCRTQRVRHGQARPC